MFELSREDICNWRKVHNQVEEFTEVPKPKTQIKKEVVKVKQQKKMPEQPQKVTLQDIMDLMVEFNRKMDEDIKKQKEEDDEYYRKQREEREEDSREFRETIHSIFKPLHETLDCIAEDIQETWNKNREPVNEKIKEKEEELENKGEIKQTKTGMNKRWEETSYPADQLKETLDSDFKPVDEMCIRDSNRL